MARAYNPEALTRLLRQRLKARDMTQDQLASALGLKQQAVSKWLNGRTRPRADVIPQLAEVLETPAEDLLRACGYLPRRTSRARPAAQSGIDISDLPPADQAQVFALVDELRARRGTK